MLRPQSWLLRPWPWDFQGKYDTLPSCILVQWHSGTMVLDILQYCIPLDSHSWRSPCYCLHFGFLHTTPGTMNIFSGSAQYTFLSTTFHSLNLYRKSSPVTNTFILFSPFTSRAVFRILLVALGNRQRLSSSPLSDM